MSRLGLTTPYLDTERFPANRKAAALRLQRRVQAAEYVPRSRIGRAVGRGGSGEGLLQACPALMEVITSRIIMTNLRPASSPPGSRRGPVEDRASLMKAHTGLGAYHWWRDAERRSAWSLIFRRGRRGDLQAPCRRLAGYLRRLNSMCRIPQQVEALGGGLHGWLQRELRRCLHLPLLRRVVRWRRQGPLELAERRRTEFLELQLARPVPGQLQRHLHALTAAYDVNRRRQYREKELTHE